MAKPRKIQLHSVGVQLWNLRELTDFATFAPTKVLAGDAWHCTASANVEVNSITIRPADTVLALMDNPGELNEANITAGKWKVLRNLSGEMLEWLDGQLYTPPHASLTGGVTLEKNHSLTAYSATFTWSVTAGTNPILTKELWKREGAGTWAKVKDLTGTSGSETVSVTINTDTQFRVQVSSKSGETIYSTIREVKFQYKTGYRVGSAAATLDDAFLNAGTMGFDTDAYRAFTANAAAGEHIFYYVPKSFVSSPYLSPPYFYVGGFEGGFEVAASNVEYELGDETTVEYVVYKSTNAGLGSTNVTVQSN